MSSPVQLSNLPVATSAALTDLTLLRKGLTDYQISGGLKWPDTVLGSFSVQAGYRSTSVSFSEDSKGNVNATWDGVFGSISYYYH